jgi:hypothetical protein
MAETRETPHNQFYQWKQLPHELRDIIWNFSMPAPRIVRVEQGFASHHIFSEPLPDILHVCRESRLISLKHYRLIFSTAKTKSCILNFERHKIIYFRHDRDLLFLNLYFNAGDFVSEFPELQNIQYLKINYCALEGFSGTRINWHTQFENIRSIQVRLELTSGSLLQDEIRYGLRLLSEILSQRSSNIAPELEFLVLLPLIKISINLCCCLPARIHIQE